MNDLPPLIEVLDLLSSACEIARRRGDSTNWPAFLACAETALAEFNRRGVTARTFRIIKDDNEGEN